MGFSLSISPRLCLVHRSQTNGWVRCNRISDPDCFSGAAGCPLVPFSGPSHITHTNTQKVQHIYDNRGSSEWDGRAVATVCALRHWCYVFMKLFFIDFPNRFRTRRQRMVIPGEAGRLLFRFRMLTPCLAGRVWAEVGPPPTGSGG